MPIAPTSFMNLSDSSASLYDESQSSYANQRDSATESTRYTYTEAQSVKDHQNQPALAKYQSEAALRPKARVRKNMGCFEAFFNAYKASWSG